MKCLLLVATTILLTACGSRTTVVERPIVVEREVSHPHPVVIEREVSHRPVVIEHERGRR